MPKTSRLAHVARSSTDLRYRVEGDICQQHEGICWHVEVWAHDIQGTGERACILYREHLGSQARALQTLATWTLKVARHVTDAERAEWLLEHQGTLFE